MNTAEVVAGSAVVHDRQQLFLWCPAPGRMTLSHFAGPRLRLHMGWSLPQLHAASCCGLSSLKHSLPGSLRLDVLSMLDSMSCNSVCHVRSSLETTRQTILRSCTRPMMTSCRPVRSSMTRWQTTRLSSSKLWRPASSFLVTQLLRSSRLSRNLHPTSSRQGSILAYQRWFAIVNCAEFSMPVDLTFGEIAHHKLGAAC